MLDHTSTSLFRAAGLLLAAAALLVVVGTINVDADDGEKGAIRDVISRQLDAFRRDDGVTAFGFASPQIQGKFGTPEFFMEMVKRGYPQVYRSKSAKFLGLKTIGDRIVQRVILESLGNDAVIAQYFMKKIDGRWRISGCVLVKPGEGV